MEKSIILHGQTINYNLKRRRGYKGVKITLKPSRQIVVTTGLLTPQIFINTVLSEKSTWIITTLKKIIAKNIPLPKKLTPTEKKDLKIKTQRLLDAKLDFFGPQIGVTWNRVTLRNQSTRWGSCSSSGNLNFNYKLSQVPDHLFDYVVVHELCHLKELNHSSRFWSLVQQVIPDYKQRRKELHKYALSLD